MLKSTSEIIDWMLRYGSTSGLISGVVHDALADHYAGRLTEKRLNLFKAELRRAVEYSEKLSTDSDFQEKLNRLSYFSKRALSSLDDQTT